MTKIYTSAVNEKFYSDGSVKYYPGITTLCHLNPKEKHYKICSDIQDLAKQSSFAHKRTFLVKNSFHMTTFDFICDDRRSKDFWTSFDKDQTAHMTKLVGLFQEKLKDISEYKKFVMVYDYLKCETDSGLSLRVKPKDDEYNKIIRDFRDECSQVMGIKHNNHDEYRFHISMDYAIELLTDEELKIYEEFGKQMDAKYKEDFGEITFDTIDYCVFHDMYNFYPIDHIKLK